MPKRLIGTAEAAVELGVSARRVRALLSQGRIRRASRVSGAWIIPAPVVVLKPDGNRRKETAHG